MVWTHLLQAGDGSGSGEEVGHQGLEEASRGQELLAYSCLLQSVYEARPGEDLCECDSTP